MSEWELSIKLVKGETNGIVKSIPTQKTLAMLLGWSGVWSNSLSFSIRRHLFEGSLTFTAETYCNLFCSLKIESCYLMSLPILKKSPVEREEKKIFLICFSLKYVFRVPGEKMYLCHSTVTCKLLLNWPHGKLGQHCARSCSILAKHFSKRCASIALFCATLTPLNKFLQVK